MIIEVEVYAEVHNKWPARNGKPGGENYQLLCLDRTRPGKYALRDMYDYVLTDDEKLKLWGFVEGHQITLVVRQIWNGERSPQWRGEILKIDGVDIDQWSPAKTPPVKAVASK